jgi:hypothetical protein
LGLGCGGLGLLAPASLVELRGGLPSGGEGGEMSLIFEFFRTLKLLVREFIILLVADSVKYIFIYSI